MEKKDIAGYLRDNKEEGLKKLNAHIDDLYKDRVYILKEGDLEDYLGGMAKGLSNVIRFCEDDFDE